jgi:hypothetical protein
VLSPLPWRVRGRLRRRRFTNFGMSFSGYWCGPYTLLPRVMISGRLNDLDTP